MKLKIKNPVLRKVIGIFLIVIGIPSLFLPFSPGFLLILTGLVLLEIDLFKNFMRELKKKIKNDKSI